MSFLVAFLLAGSPVANPTMPVETYVEAAGPSGPLKGTMLSPSKAGAPVVLIIPGSGPVDRDGNNSQGLKAASLKLLAEGLAANGIATVRIDKRGMYASAAAIPDANAVTISGYATDVHSWATSIRHQTGAKCVWVLGHSEGGLVALAAGRDSSDTNHVLKTVASDDRGSNIATYADPSLPLAPNVVSSIVDFVKGGG